MILAQEFSNILAVSKRRIILKDHRPDTLVSEHLVS
jgi:hypothetical protein